jgi:hypothetical protein
VPAAAGQNWENSSFVILMSLGGEAMSMRPYFVKQNHAPPLKFHQNCGSRRLGLQQSLAIPKEFCNPVEILAISKILPLINTFAPAWAGAVGEVNGARYANGPV